jgi:hypothetical protein
METTTGGNVIFVYDSIAKRELWECEEEHMETFWVSRSRWVNPRSRYKQDANKIVKRISSE